MLFSIAKADAGLTNAQVLKEAQAALASGDYEKAFAAYQVVAENNENTLAQFSLGLFYQNGWGRTKDEVTACQWFEKAAKGGIPTAQHLTGTCFERGIHHPASSETAAIWYQKAAQSGQSHAFCNLGNLYMTGQGVPKNPIKALELCHPAAQQGSVPAQIWMGKFYLEGDHSVRDYKKAYQWFELAAQKQSAEAFYYLGIIIRQGLLPEHSAQKAQQMFEQAAALKYVPAYFQTGKGFYNAQPDPETNQLSAEHLAKAYLWFSAAIQQSEDAEEITEAIQILKQVLAVMPKTWLADLDSKVTQHIEADHKELTTADQISSP